MGDFAELDFFILQYMKTSSEMNENARYGVYSWLAHAAHLYIHIWLLW